MLSGKQLVETTWASEDSNWGYCFCGADIQRCEDNVHCRIPGTISLKLKHFYNNATHQKQRKTSAIGFQYSYDIGVINWIGMLLRIFHFIFWCLQRYDQR